MISKDKVFITGANGFVGKHLCAYLKSKAVPIIAGVRSARNPDEVAYGHFDDKMNWHPYLTNVVSIVHLAGRAHKFNNDSSNPLMNFRKVNTEATLRLAEQAKQMGVRQFIYISTIKVNGEYTQNTPFDTQSPTNPIDDYAISKFEAEKLLLELHEPNVFEVTIIRPPLIYGPGVKGNLALIEKLIRFPLPLPFKSIHNKRSLVSVYNLSDLIFTCLNNKKAAGQIFLIADKKTYSLGEIITHLSHIHKKRVFLLNFPMSILIGFFKVVGLQTLNDRLFSNLEVDISKTRQLLNWQPEFDFEQTYKINLL